MRVAQLGCPSDTIGVGEQGGGAKIFIPSFDSKKLRKGRVAEALFYSLIYLNVLVNTCIFTVCVQFVLHQYGLVCCLSVLKGGSSLFLCFSAGVMCVHFVHAYIRTWSRALPCWVVG